jgi:uncharacterized protein
MELRGKWALVTGASSGIGEHIARLLAERGMSLVLTARRTERLEKLAAQLRARHAVEIACVTADLSDPAAPRKLFDQTEGAGRAIDVLINNAGFGTHGDFAEIPWEKTTEQMRLNVFSLVELTHLFLAPMKQRDRGWILEVASVQAYMPVPGYATYGAGKAFVRNFSEAIAHELRKTNVRVCCLCPGGTFTEFAGVAGHDLPGFYRLGMMKVEPVARAGVRGLFAGRRLVVPGIFNELTVFFYRFLPRRLQAWLTAQFTA